MKKNLLITGGLGFIGTNLVKMLSTYYEISLIDNLSNLTLSKADLTNQSGVTIGDIKEYDTCLSVTKDIDIIIHLAAKGNVIESVTNPLDNFNNNVIGTFNIFRAAAENKVKRIVFASTGGALMGDCELPVSEQSLPHPIAPYGASKMAGEGYAHAFSNAYDISITILRFANIYGPFSLHKTGLINVVMKNILEDKSSVVYGNEISRDFLYVDDLCRGIQKVLKFDHPGSEIFHLASGQEQSILKAVQLLHKIAGKEDLEIKVLPERKGEVGNNVAEYTKAKECFKFSPSVDINQGLKLTWDWYKSMRV